LLCRLDEHHARDIIAAIAANASQRLVGFREQALALVKANGLHINPGGLGKCTNGETVFLALKLIFHKVLDSVLDYRLILRSLQLPIYLRKHLMTLMTRIAD
jgi:hypothetical protein